jgi:hypothetical protein
MVHKFTEAEAEIVLLYAIKNLIDSIVNFEVLRLLGEDLIAEVRFNSPTHQKYFNLMLVDFLSETDRHAPLTQTSYLDGLRNIADKPQFDVNDSVVALRQATIELASWLGKEIESPITWFPSIHLNIPLRLTRSEFIKITGNISKHNFLRLYRVAGQVKSIFSRSGHQLTLEDSILALEDFYERFHTDLLNYHSTTISELLNNIRWGIYAYLQPELSRSICQDGAEPHLHRYECPRSITSAISRNCYSELMGWARQPPYVRKFRTPECLKLRY